MAEGDEARKLAEERDAALKRAEEAEERRSETVAMCAQQQERLREAREIILGWVACDPEVERTKRWLEHADE